MIKLEGENRASLRLILPMSIRKLNLWDLYTVFINTKERMVEFLQEIKLINKSMTCVDCGNDMVFNLRRGPLGTFRCQRKNHNGQKSYSVSAARGSLFEESKLAPEKLLVLTYQFVYEANYEAAVRESSIDK